MLSHLLGKRVLVLEDNYLAATEIGDALEAARAVVVGPCADIDDAEIQAMHSELAILDINIRGRTAFALADRLRLLEVPYVFFSGYDREYLPQRFANVDFIRKPTSPVVALQYLDLLSHESEKQTVTALIPMLRARARTYLSDPLAADRLVERTLQLALDDEGPIASGARLAPWLQFLMDVTVQERGPWYLN